MDPAALVSDVSVHGSWQRFHAAQDSQEVEESSVTKESGGSGSRSARGYGMADYEATHPMVVGSRKENGDSKPESSSGICCKLADQNVQASEAPKQDYIHVRAKRGQATDSHSLAERARREKISERMKILQDLVPGCNKVIGKATVLDEIINYIQSLQCQVEFLSMKLEAVDSRMSSTNEGFPTKDFAIQTLDHTAGSVFSPPRDYVQDSASEWLHMQVGGGLDRTS